jgi:chaperonin GroES
LHEPSPFARSRHRQASRPGNQNCVRPDHPDAAAEKPDQGEILAVGNGKVQDDGKVRALEVKVGDRVLFGKYSGQTVKVDGDELLVMREEDIMAVLVK